MTAQTTSTDRLGSGPQELVPVAKPLEPLRLSAIVCAYNEERNLPGLLDALLTASGESFVLDELICVASGCTDRTVEILEAARARDRRVRLIVQAERTGKASALNAGMAAARGAVVLIENADTLPAPGALDALVRPFRDPEVRLVTSRPVPVSGRSTPAERLGALIWLFHDVISRHQPKAGEAFAIRRAPVTVPEDVEDDDTFVQAYFAQDGGRSVYAREAIIYNRVPSSLSELARQRFRINRQIVSLYRRHRISTATWTPGKVLSALRTFLNETPGRLPMLVFLVSMEALIRVVAVAALFLTPAPMRRWTPISSTKSAIETPKAGASVSELSPPGRGFLR